MSPDSGIRRHIVCSSGGLGIMEAANRGATEAGGRTLGLDIGLPFEQKPNPWIPPGLCFELHYFFMRKLWFAHLARALIVFPGGFGTLDDLMEMLSLVQTGKLDRSIPILLYGTEYWKEIVNFEALARHGMIKVEDLCVFRYVDDPQTALAMLKASLKKEPGAQMPEIAASRTPES